MNRSTKRQKEVLKTYGYMPCTTKQESIIGAIKGGMHGHYGDYEVVVNRKSGVATVYIGSMTYQIAPSGTVIRKYEGRRGGKK